MPPDRATMNASSNPQARRGRVPHWLAVVVVLIVVAACIAISVIATATALNQEFLDRADASGRADSQGLLELAAKLRPDLAEPDEELADMVSAGSPNRAHAFALRAVELDPMNWQGWETLALIDYQLDRPEAARRDFEQAVHDAAGFQAHFDLGSFELLQSNLNGFRTQMRAALAVGDVGDVDSVLRLVVDAATGAGVDAGTLLSQLLPKDRPEINAEAVRYFQDRGLYSDAITAWNLMNCAEPTPCARPAVLLSNSLAVHAFLGGPAVGRGLIESARDVWNRAVQNHAISQSQARTGYSNDSGFSRDWQGPAFSWQASGAVPLRRTADLGGAVTADFSLTQTDQATLLTQIDAVQPLSTYSLSFESRRLGGDPNGGVSVIVYRGVNDPIFSLAAPLTPNWQLSSGQFRVPAGVAVVSLSWVYQRPAGDLPLSEPVQIARLELTPVHASESR